MNTRQAAWDTAHGLYCSRACGVTPSGGHSTYTGSMDLLAFVERCRVPESSKLEEHEACWDDMRRRFAEAWLSHTASAA